MPEKSTSRAADTKVQNFQEAGLDTPIQYCPGVGPRRGAILANLGISTVYDLLWHLPRAYEDHHNQIPIRHLQDGQVATVTGEVVSVEARLPRNQTKVKHIYKVMVEDFSGTLAVTWFNQAFLAQKIRVGTRLSLHGKVEQYDYYKQMSSPKYSILDNEPQAHSEIIPLYPLSEGLTQGQIQSAVRKAMEKFLVCCREFLSSEILAKYHFPERMNAFRILHQPQPGEGAPTDIAGQQDELLFEQLNDLPEQPRETETPWRKAQQRLIFEELYLHQLILNRQSLMVQRQEGIAHIPPDPDPFQNEPGELNPHNPGHWAAFFIQNLPFELTEDQRQVCQEIQKDMCSHAPMNRLLQGEVGSGKTVVSLYGMILAAASGNQAILMAPTEILAQQHTRSIRKFTQGIPGLNTIVITGSTTTAQRREAQELISTGVAQIIVGTHALFQENIHFPNVSLIIVDEQHKFGVHQRQQLVEKGTHPDLLVATATPIPRTLSLTVFGDMDVSTIRTLPPGRPPLITRWTTWENEEKIWSFVDEKIRDGQQVYVVCPIIEPSEVNPHLPSTDEAFEKISQTFLPHRRVAVLHGRHSPDEKQLLMEQMQKGEIDVVVATTVIEVGVDLPNATIMVILGAERFGLAQLHQLRGRVGRGSRKSYCILVTSDKISPVARHRMRIMEESRDGFAIAEQDMRLRGPGEQFGTKQSGFFKFRVADPFRDSEILQWARDAARTTLQKDPDFHLEEHALLRRELERNYGTADSFRPS